MLGDAGFDVRSHQGNGPNERVRAPKGQALVELALVLPFLLLVIVGALELGRVFYAKIVITNAAREGAYYLSTNATDQTNCSGTGSSQICYLGTISAIEAEANNSGVTITDSNMTIKISTCTGGTGCMGLPSAVISVNTTVDNLVLITLINNGMGIQTSHNSMLLSSTVQMVMQ